VADNGELICISDAADERIRARNLGLDQAGAFSLLAAPLMDRDSLVGVVEAVNRLDGLPFDEDDEFLLTNICETANNALHNASLLLAERKVEILEALVKVSAEITSTLDLDRVLDAVVNGAAAVIPFERAAIALEQRGHLQVRAVTGMPRINPQDPAVVRLKELLEWASLSREAILVTQRGDEIDDPRAETRAKFEKYFSESGMRAFHALPLSDDDGNLGVLSFESSNPDFLIPAHVEMIQVLAGQATVALRNASLYREVPFISVLQPVLQGKRKFLAVEKRRRALMLAGAAAVALLLVVVPFPLRVSGDAVVAPSHSARVQPEVAGVVTRVEAREGDAVRAGQVLATLGDWQYRANLAEAEAKYNAAVSSMNSALAHDDGREAGIQRVQADYWSSELQRSRERLARTQLRSPMDGTVATPRIEDLVGKTLQPGDTLAEVVDTSTATVDVAIAEADANLLHAGEGASVKLEGFPTKTFRGKVTVVSPRADVLDAERYFYARVAVPNGDGAIRPGMQGRGKVRTGWTPAGRVLFRRPAMWLWEKLWAWMGW
jgi:RND family efflux transporter MFP subunit